MTDETDAGRATLLRRYTDLINKRAEMDSALFQQCFENILFDAILEIELLQDSIKRLKDQNKKRPVR